MATHTRGHTLAHSHTLSRWQALFVALSMTIVKCHVQVQTSTQNAAICMHYAWPEIQSYIQAAADSRTRSGSGSGTGSGCQLSQNGHKTFTIYHALLRTILATFGACVERAQQGQSLAHSSSLSLAHYLALSSPSPLLQLFAKLVIYTCTRQQQEEEQEEEEERHGAFIWQKLTELLHCKLNSGCLPCAREVTRCPRDVCVICRRTCCCCCCGCSRCTCHLSV